MGKDNKDIIYNLGECMHGISKFSNLVMDKRHISFDKLSIQVKAKVNDYHSSCNKCKGKKLGLGWYLVSKVKTANPSLNQFEIKLELVIELD